MRLFIAEKELQGKAIADALSDKQVDKRGYIICGESDIVTWASGHMYEQAAPEFYDPKYKSWKMEDLPIIPARWELIPVENKVKQLETIHSLIERADVIVHSCDFDREGQLIGDEILAKGPDPKKGAQIMRLNTSGGLTKAAIQDALKEMKLNSEFVAMGLSALARARADWIVGMNMSRAYTLAGREAGYHKGDVLSVGRVQTPTLALVVKRDREIENFKPIDYYLVVALLKHDNGEFVASWKPKEGLEGVDAERRVLKKEVADALVHRVKGRTGRVVAYKSEEVDEKAPLPHNLTTLQIQANERHGLTAGQVLAAAQALYERYKVISYPRSDCRYLPESQHADAISVLHAIAKNDPEKSILCDNANTDIRSEAWNNTKLGSHHGIVPLATVTDLAALNRDERIVYDLICRAYIAQFYEPALYQAIGIEVNIANETFEAKQRDMKFPGWRLLYPPKTEKTKEKPKLPEVEIGDKASCVDIDIAEKKTTPPARFTDAGLIMAMNNVDKFIDDEEIKKRLAGSGGIGTEATRADIIETLLQRKLLERQGRQVISTRMGRDLIDAVPDEMSSPGLTAIYEQVLERIAAGQFRMDLFLQKQAEVIKELVANATVKPRIYVDEDEEPEDDGFLAHKPKTFKKKKHGSAA